MTSPSYALGDMPGLHIWELVRSGGYIMRPKRSILERIIRFRGSREQLGKAGAAQPTVGWPGAPHKLPLLPVTPPKGSPSSTASHLIWAPERSGKAV